MQTLGRLLSKIDKASEPTKSIDIKGLESTLILQSGKKVIALADDAGKARAARQAKLLELDNDSISSMETMGRWIRNQKWLTGKLTILDVLNKWSSWWPKALEANHGNTNAGPGINGPSDEFTVRRTPQGFR